MTTNKQVSIREDPNSNAWILHVEKAPIKPKVILVDKPLQWGHHMRTTRSMKMSS